MSTNSNNKVLKISDYSDTVFEQGDQKKDIMPDRYKLLFEYSRDIILFIRTNGSIVDANTAAINAYGYTYDELTSLSIFEIREQTDIELLKQMNSAKSEGILFETFHRCKDGSVFPVEVNSQGVQIGNECILISIIRDITKRKNDEYDLEKLTAELKKKKQLNEALVILNTIGQVKYANPKAKQLVSNIFKTDEPVKELSIFIKNNLQYLNSNNQVVGNGLVVKFYPFLTYPDIKIAILNKQPQKGNFFCLKGTLTTREIEVIELLSKGLNNKEIATKLYITPNTVKRHLSNAYCKLDVSSRTELLSKAYQLMKESK
ncbi:MAG: PAS domain S-box protein [Firmicutes bacterium]|nr:PAS domain S-box protein [Bacillota bacterium]